MRQIPCRNFLKRKGNLIKRRVKLLHQTVHRTRDFLALSILHFNLSAAREVALLGVQSDVQNRFTQFAIGL